MCRAVEREWAAGTGTLGASGITVNVPDQFRRRGRDVRLRLLQLTSVTGSNNAAILKIAGKTSGRVYHGAVIPPLGSYNSTETRLYTGTLDLGGVTLEASDVNGEEAVTGVLITRLNGADAEGAVIQFESDNPHPGPGCDDEEG